ncbi:MAG TPA: tetratricopeptide repeat protein [Opitutaceae bacterium]|nr:tetratricopeptide repeat protein [Opitutaceae bacterium]
MRRALLRMGRRDARASALAAAGIWAVHPLLSEAVMGVVQRDEILASLFLLLTLLELDRGRLRLSFVACLLGVASKEIAVAAPLLALLYDRAFLAGSFRRAWRERRRYYLALASTWMPLGVLMATSRHRDNTVGFGLGVSPWSYLLTEARAIAHYLRLGAWPRPLVIDYGTELAPNLGAVWPEGLLVLALLGLTAWALVRRPALGFLGAAFFAVLAPSSSFVPLVTQPVAEHRMYLPLASLIVLLIAGAGSWAGKRLLPAWAAAAALLALATAGRVGDYRAELPLWEGALAASPRNDRAWLNLGTLWSHRGRGDQAIACYRQALALDPGQADTHFDLAAELDRAGLLGEAIPEYREAERLDPERPNAPYYLGLALARSGRLADAVAPLERAAALRPGSAAAGRALAEVRAALGRP